MKTILSVLVLAAIALGVYYFFPATFSKPGDTAGSVATSTQPIAYTNASYGISFDYPRSYVLDEYTITEGIPSYTIVLMDADDAANIPMGGEGPASISVSIFDATTTSASTWVQESIASNFQLAMGPLSEASVDGKAAVAYRTDGLYATDNIVVIHEGKAYMFSVGWIAETDAIRSDFAQLVASVTLN